MPDTPLTPTQAADLIRHLQERVWTSSEVGLFAELVAPLLPSADDD